MAKYKGTAVHPQNKNLNKLLKLMKSIVIYINNGNVICAYGPTHNNHLTNKNYVDTSVSGLVDSAQIY